MKLKDGVKEKAKATDCLKLQSDSKQSRISKKPFSSWLSTKFSLSKTKRPKKYEMPIQTLCKTLAL